MSAGRVWLREKWHVYWESVAKGRAARILRKHGSGKSSLYNGKVLLRKCTTPTVKAWLREKQPSSPECMAKGKTVFLLEKGC